MPDRRAILLILAAPFLFASAHCAAQPGEDPFASARNQLVDKEIVAAGVKNPRVIEAMRNTPRHEFVPRENRAQAYYDMAIPIGHEQTISPPFVVAFMTEVLDPLPTDRVLEIGTGSGYQAAVLSPLVKDVYTIEIVEPLGRRAAGTLRRLGYENVHAKIGDGYQGWPEHAPFDKIIVTCSPEDIPKPLVEQLAEGGRIVVPLGERFNQTLYLFTKKEGRLVREALQGTFFVPMTGAAEEQRDVLPEGELTGLAGGSFEETIGATDEPAGWYYLRQGRVESTGDAPAGQRVLTFTNATPGRGAHAMQAFGVDGREVESVHVSVHVRGEGLARGQSPQQLPHVLVEFYDAQRALAGRGLVGPFEGSFAWKEEGARIDVPARARLAVIGVGLFGATGTISFDDVQIGSPRRR